jgi:hypothetical protein
MELELDVLGALGKLVKYVVRLSKRKKLKKVKIKILHTSYPNCKRPIFYLKEF